MWSTQSLGHKKHLLIGSNNSFKGFTKDGPVPCSTYLGSNKTSAQGPELYSADIEVSCSHVLRSTCGHDVETKTSGGPILGIYPVSAGDTEPVVKKLKADVSVGAGDEIHQDLAKDPLKVSEWKPEPAAMIRLYFVFAGQFEEIVKKGIVSLDGDKEGFMKGLPVG